MGPSAATGPWEFAHPIQVRVGDCMSSPAIACYPDTPVEDATQLMGEHRIRRIPVIDENNCCIGIVAQTDLLSEITDIALVLDTLRRISIPHGKVRETPLKLTAAGKAPSAGNRKKKTNKI